MHSVSASINRRDAAAPRSIRLVPAQHPLKNTLTEPVEPAVVAPRCSGRKNRAHIIGVVVNETTSETAIATESVTANSRNRRPTMPPISRMGMNTATSDRLIERTVKPISSAPRKAACNGDSPAPGTA